MRVRVKRVSIWSAAKVGCLMTAFPILCLASVFLVLVLMPSIAVAPNLEYQLRLIGGGSSGTFVVIFYAVLAGIGAAISWAVGAIIYNLVAWLFGGLEIALERQRVDTPRPPIHSQFDEQN